MDVMMIMMMMVVVMVMMINKFLFPPPSFATSRRFSPFSLILATFPVKLPLQSPFKSPY